MKIGLALLCALIMLIGGRLLQLQGLDGSAYASTGEKQRLEFETLKANRGAILDRNGSRLAYSVEAADVFADPSQIPAAKRVTVATAVSKALALPYSEVLLKISAKGRYVVLARAVDPTVAEALKQTLAADELGGIASTRVQKRIYPGANIGAQVVGFLNADGIGQAGIEKSFDRQLTGKDGELIYEASNGIAIPAGYRKETPAQQGTTVTLTVDQDLQYMTQNLVDEYQAATGVPEIQAVVQDVKTGQVLAMVATPGYDPSQPGKSDVTALGNPVVSDIIEPGSVNKVTTIGPALNEGVVTPSTVLTVDGKIQVADRVIKDAWVHGPINFTTTGIIAKSSNVGTIMVNEKLGGPLFYQYLQKFGVGQRTGIELPNESKGILADYGDWSGSQKGNVPIGQGVGMTVLQMASIYQTIANDGVRIPPRIVKSVTAPDGAVTTTKTPTGVEVLSADTSAKLRTMLEAVVGKGGTAPLAAVSGYRVGGKTGTAQRPNPNGGGYAGGGYFHTFSGMAPIENPRYVVAIAVTDPTGGQYGNAIASKLFSQIMSSVLQKTATPPSTTPRPDFQLTA